LLLQLIEKRWINDKWIWWIQRKTIFYISWHY
jgi:hypothetical protein